MSGSYRHRRSAVRAAQVALVAYLTVLFVLTFFPFPLPVYQPPSGDSAWRLNLVPLATIARAFELGPASPAYRLVLGNVVAFIPLGLLLPVLAQRRAALTVVFFVALTLSIGIELGQLGVSLAIGYTYRSTDVDDVILNVLGAAVGLAAFHVAELSARWLRR